MDDIVETAEKAGSFKTLVTAARAAGLVDALKAPGPFMVFAPTDDAFSKLSQDTISSLLGDKPKLKAILTYHVVGGKVMSKDAIALASSPETR